MTLRKKMEKLPKKWGKSAGKILANHAKDIRGVMALTKSQCSSEIQHLLDCEADCIKSGNSLSPKEQKVALDVIANIQQRIYGKEIK